MKLAPVKHYKDPGYPTRDSILSNPHYLNDCVPTRWKGNKIVATMLAIYLFGSEKTEAQIGGVTGNRPVMVKGDQGDQAKTPERRKESPREIPSIAPIFLHGDGRGATGCVVMNPPVFLSEEEARQIIEEELMKDSILFDKKNVKLDDVVVQEEFDWKKGDGIPVNLDGYSSKYNLGYEVVTADDYHKFGGSYSLSTVQSYDLVKAAENLRNKMKDYGKMNVVVFYDPMERDEIADRKNATYEDMLRHDELFEESDGIQVRRMRSVDKNKSIELLKRQVSDFIDWAKKEGLIEKQ